MRNQICGSGTTSEFLAYLGTLSVQLTIRDGRLACNAPKGVLTPELQSEITARKPEILLVLEEGRPRLESPALLSDAVPTSYPSLCIHEWIEQQALETPDAIAAGTAEVSGSLTAN